MSAIETEFAVDSSGFSISKFDRWFDEKWGKGKAQRHWLKAHIATGVLTNIVTAIEITGPRVADSPVMPTLLDATAKHFTMAGVSGDKAYLADSNFRRIVEHGAYPYIPFKSNSEGRGSTLWRQLYAVFVTSEPEFMRRYHLRSNVETTFSMVKGKFGDSVRSKTETGQTNEILLKFVCHNLVVLVHAMHDLDIQPSFEPKIVRLFSN